MAFERRAAIAAMALLVSGCGGGGESGSGGVTLPPTGGTPTTTPTPSPTYATYGDLQSQWKAPTAYALTEFTTTIGSLPASTTSSLETSGVDMTLWGDPNVSGHFVDIAKGKSISFSAGDVANKTADGLVFYKQGADSNAPETGITSIGIYFPKIADDQYRYQYLAWMNAFYRELISANGPSHYTERGFTFVIGSKTEPTDLPSNDLSYSGYMQLSYADQMQGGFVPTASLGSLTLSKTGGLSGTLRFQNGASFQASITGAMDQQTHMITGDITSSDGRYAGRLQGYLYGPKGKELGLLVDLKSQNGQFGTSGFIIGHLAGA